MENEQQESKQATEVASNEREPVFSWSALEYVQYERSKQWYIVAGIVLALTIIFSVITGNWTLAIAAVVFAGVYEYTQRQHPPKRIDIKITDLGIHVGHMFFPYSHIKAFWMHYGHGVKTLNIRVHKRIYSDVVIQLDRQDPAAIREYLMGQIPEWEGKHERLADVVTRLLRL